MSGSVSVNRPEGTRRNVAPCTGADIRRLALVGRAMGIQVYRLAGHDRTPAYGRMYAATSRSAADLVYLVSAAGCTCDGYSRAGRCSHWACLVEYLGWGPGADEPGRATPAQHAAAVARLAKAEQQWAAKPEPDPESPIGGAVIRLRQIWGMLDDGETAAAAREIGWLGQKLAAGRGGTPPPTRNRRRRR